MKYSKIRLFCTYGVAKKINKPVIITLSIVFEIKRKVIFIEIQLWKKVGRMWMIKTDNFNDTIWCRNLIYLEHLGIEQWGRIREREM